ncbi:MAG: lysine decarboxylase [Synechococcaceae cyanobacterium]|nr:lysine decarboxylase [Synechococcaceae cyanobacterium]
MRPPSDPLLRLLAAASGSRLALHLPAHGGGRGLAPELQRLLRRPPGSWDLPELPEMGGPLEPDGAVADSQRRCAALLGAELCRFGVQGASGLLQAALLALAPPGSRVLLPRNLHRSLLHGCLLGQLQPVLFDLPFDPLSGLWLPPDPARLQSALDAALAAGPLAAVALVDPTYQGLSADLQPLVERVHGRGLPLLVDQAHGRGEALSAGADLVVLSLQKSGGGLAQSAALLAQGPRVEAAALDRALLWLQTSSPSALLLASSAAAIAHQCSPRGQRQQAAAAARGRRLRLRLEALGFTTLAGDDPLRLVLATSPLGISGARADAWLLEQGIVAELPEPGALTFCLGSEPPARLERRLPAALLALRRELAATPLPPFTPPPLPLVASPELPLAQAWRAAAEPVALAAAAGRIAAEPLCPYPPGIPLLIPGERLDAARADWLLQQRRIWPEQVAATVQVVAGV